MKLLNTGGGDGGPIHWDPFGKRKGLGVKGVDVIPLLLSFREVQYHVLVPLLGIFHGPYPGSCLLSSTD